MATLVKLYNITPVSLTLGRIQSDKIIDIINLLAVVVVVGFVVIMFRCILF